MEAYTDVPFFPGYKISRTGVLKDSNDREISAYVNDAGYFCSRVVKDGKVKIIRVHRLVIVTYGEKIEDWETRLVNHKDGDKQNIDIDNLEWASYAENNQHAYENGLNRNGLPFLAFDVVHNKVYDFVNTREASMTMPFTREEIYDALKSGSCMPCKTWWFAAWDDVRSWTDIMLTPDYVPAIKRYTKYDAGIVCYNAEEDVLHLVDNLNQAVTISSLNRQTIQKKLDRGSLLPTKSWCFKFITDQTPFKKYSKEELDFISRCVGNSVPIKASNLKTKEVKLFASLYEFTEYLGFKRERASNVRAAVAKKGHFKNWVYEKL